MEAGFTYFRVNDNIGLAEAHQPQGSPSLTPPAFTVASQSSLLVRGGLFCVSGWFVSRLIEQALRRASISTIVGIQARGLLCVSGGLD